MFLFWFFMDWISTWTFPAPNETHAAWLEVPVRTMPTARNNVPKTGRAIWQLDPTVMPQTVTPPSTFSTADNECRRLVAGGHAADAVGGRGSGWSPDADVIRQQPVAGDNSWVGTAVSVTTGDRRAWTATTRLAVGKRMRTRVVGSGTSVGKRWLAVDIGYKIIQGGGQIINSSIGWRGMWLRKFRRKFSQQSSLIFLTYQSAR